MEELSVLPEVSKDSGAGPKSAPTTSGYYGLAPRFPGGKGLAKFARFCPQKFVPYGPFKVKQWASWISQPLNGLNKKLGAFTLPEGIVDARLLKATDLEALVRRSRRFGMVGISSVVIGTADGRKGFSIILNLDGTGIAVSASPEVKTPKVILDLFLNKGILKISPTPVEDRALYGSNAFKRLVDCRFHWKMYLHVPEGVPVRKSLLHNFPEPLLVNAPTNNADPGTLLYLAAILRRSVGLLARQTFLNYGADVSQEAWDATPHMVYMSGLVADRQFGNKVAYQGFGPEPLPSYSPDTNDLKTVYGIMDENQGFLKVMHFQLPSVLSVPAELRNKAKPIQKVAAETWQFRVPPIMCEMRTSRLTDFTRLCKRCGSLDHPIESCPKSRSVFCTYPLCKMSGHELAACPTLSGACDLCNRRGHVDEHHKVHRPLVLDQVFLAWSPFHTMCGLPLLELEETRKHHLADHTWKMSLYQSGRYESEKVMASFGISFEERPKTIQIVSDPYYENAPLEAFPESFRAEVMEKRRASEAPEDDDPDAVEVLVDVLHSTKPLSLEEAKRRQLDALRKRRAALAPLLNPTAGQDRQALFCSISPDFWAIEYEYTDATIAVMEAEGLVPSPQHSKAQPARDLSARTSKPLSGKPHSQHKDKGGEAPKRNEKPKQDQASQGSKAPPKPSGQKRKWKIPKKGPSSKPATGTDPVPSTSAAGSQPVAPKAAGSQQSQGKSKEDRSRPPTKESSQKKRKHSRGKHSEPSKDRAPRDSKQPRN